MKTLKIERDARGVAMVAFNRPEVHNAFDETMIREVIEAFRDLGEDESVRAIIIAAEGKSFCAGADLNWMKKMAGYSRAENVADAEALAEMLRVLNDLPKPTVARVHGNAFGGAGTLPRSATSSQAPHAASTMPSRRARTSAPDCPPAAKWAHFIGQTPRRIPQRSSLHHKPRYPVVESNRRPQN